MANDMSQERAAERILDDESLISNLTDAEAKVLVDWAMQELASATLAAADVAAESPVERIRQAMREINDLVGNRQNLVADDLEERMRGLLVADMDPKSQRRLALEREIAQVTAEKDHVDGADLVRRMTAVASKAWRENAAVPMQGGEASRPTPAKSAGDSTQSTVRPPAETTTTGRGLLKRLLGKK